MSAEATFYLACAEVGIVLYLVGRAWASWNEEERRGRRIRRRWRQQR